MLTYADVCGRLLTYAVAYGDVCVQSVEAPGINGSGLANVSGGGGNGSATWVAEVREHCCMCMLTYADVC
jgi:hypothetical protein